MTAYPLFLNKKNPKKTFLFLICAKKIVIEGFETQYYS